MKVQVKRAFETYFLSPKNLKTAYKLCMKFSSTIYAEVPISPINTNVQRCLYPLFQAQRPHFLMLHLFRRISQLSGQDQQNDKETYCWLRPYSFRINFKDTPSHIFMDSKGVYLAIIFLEFFCQNCISQHGCEKFQIHAVKITRKYICQSKDWMFIHAPKQISPSGFYHHQSR